MAGSSGQTDVEDFLQGYITDDKITISDNQAIFLYDYNNFNSTYPYRYFYQFHRAHDDHWDPCYVETTPEYEDFLEDKAKWDENNDNRDFQDLVVLADLSVPEEDTPDTVDVVTGSGTITKQVKFQHSQEAYNIATSLITSKIGQSGKSIVQIDCIDKNEINSNH